MDYLMAWKTKFCSIPDGAEVICWDLDSTLRSTMHRRHLIPEILAGRKTWHDYSLLCSDDEPVEGAVTVLRMLGNQAWNIAVSGSSLQALDLTCSWCHLHDVPLDDFMLRPDDTPNGEWKVAAVRQLQEAGLIVKLFVEDWGEIARQIKAETGVPVLGVNPFDQGSALVTESRLTGALDEISKGAGIWPSRSEAPKLAPDLFRRLGGAW